MAKAKGSDTEPIMSQHMRPALTPEARENQMIYLAESLAEKQLMEGTASAQVIVHYLKLASTKEKAELEKLKADTAWRQAQVEAINSAQRVEALYEDAMRAFRSYSGYGDTDEYDED